MTAVVLAATGFCIVISGCATATSPAANQTHVSTPSPGNTSQTATVITAQSVEIPDTTPVNQLGQVIFANRRTAWIMGGADQQSAAKYYSGNLSLTDQAKAIADPIDAAFVSGMFTQAALTDAATVRFITDTETDHVDRLGYYLITAHDAKVYSFTSTADQTEIVSQSSSGVELHVTATDHNNVVPTDKIGSRYGTSEVQDNGAVGVFDIKLVDMSGVFKINSIANLTS